MARVGDNDYVTHVAPCATDSNAKPRSVHVRHALAVLIAVAVAFATAAAAAEHKRKPDGRKPAASRGDRALVGLSIFSSDGKRVGKVIATGVDDNDKAVLVAEIERPLGIGSAAVAIPFDMFTRQSNRIVLTITADEVEKRISGSGRKR